MTRGGRRRARAETTRSESSPFLDGPAEHMRLSRIKWGESEYLVFSAPLMPEANVRLTPAERAVSALMLEGLGNAEIARVRRVSPRTVANQAAIIFGELGVGSRAQLVARAMVTRDAPGARQRKR